MKRDDKKQVMGTFSRHTKDTGSPEVQIAILTRRIESLSEHLKDHAHDDHSRRGLLGLVSKRRKLLNYLKVSKKDKYETLIEKLGLRK